MVQAYGEILFSDKKALGGNVRKHRHEWILKA